MVVATISPFQTTAITPTQTGGLDITSLMNTILPLMTLMLVFGLIMPMFKSMGKAFQS